MFLKEGGRGWGLSPQDGRFPDRLLFVVHNLWRGPSILVALSHCRIGRWPVDRRRPPSHFAPGFVLRTSLIPSTAIAFKASSPIVSLWNESLGVFFYYLATVVRRSYFFLLVCYFFRGGGGGGGAKRIETDLKKRKRCDHHWARAGVVASQSDSERN